MCVSEGESVLGRESSKYKDPGGRLVPSEWRDTVSREVNKQDNRSWGWAM